MRTLENGGNGACCVVRKQKKILMPFSSPQRPFLLVTWSAKRRATRQGHFKTICTGNENDSIAVACTCAETCNEPNKGRDFNLANFVFFHNCT